MMKQIKAIKCSDGLWEFFDSDGNLVSRHITAGHMAQQYRDLFNELARREDTPEEIIDGMPARREQVVKNGMTDAEIAVMQHLVDFWNAYLRLPDTTGVTETTEIRHALHVIQGVLAIRVARRANPEIWR